MVTAPGPDGFKNILGGSLTCPKCQVQMRILAFIEEEEVIEKILKHLGLWNLKVNPPLKVQVSSVRISI